MDNEFKRLIQTNPSEFESLVVTDPDLVDEGIDISGLKTKTDTSPYLLGNIPDYQGIQYSTLAPTKYSDLMKLYSQGLPTIDTSQPTTPAPPSGGGGSGDGGQETTPGILEDQRLIDEGIGIQAEPGGPVFAPGEEPVTQDQIDAYNQIPVNTDYTIGSIDPVDDAIATTGLLPGIEFDPDTGTYDEANLIEGNQYTDLPVDEGGPPSILNPATYADTRDSADLEAAGGVTAGIEDLGYQTDYYGDPNEDLIEREAVPEEGGMPISRDEAKTSISTDEFDVTTDQFTRPTMADVAGPTDFTEAPITIQQTVVDGRPVDEEDIEGIAITTDAPSNIVMAKDPEGVVDPFDGKYTMSTAITPEDTTESAVDKIKNTLGLDNLDIPGAIIDTAINTITSKAIDGLAPVTLVYNLGKKLFEEQKQKTAVREAAEEQARQDRIDEAAAITRRIEEEDRQRRETEAAEAAAARAREEAAVARAREEAAQRAREEAARAAEIAHYKE
jgi:hypothetical protein